MLGQGKRSNRTINLPKIQYSKADKWDKGNYSRLDADRTPLDGLRVTENVQLSQDGVIEPRPGLKLYGTPTYTRGTSAVSTSINLIPNPTFEVNTTGWSIYGSSTLTRITSDFYTGTASLKVQTQVAAGNSGTTATITGLSIGQTYTLSTYAKGAGVGLNIYVGTSSNPQSDFALTGSWVRYGLTFVATATSHDIFLRSVNTSSTYYIDGVQLELATAASDYFDGSLATVDDTVGALSTIYAWTGTAHASTSTRTVYTYAPAQILGQVYEYVALNTATTPPVPEAWLICMQVIGGVGRVVIAKDGGTWQTISGKTYSATAKAHFEQVFGKVVITNGVDNLSYMDIATQTISQFVALTQPTTAPTIALPTSPPTGFTGSNATYRYRYTYSNLGETAASPAQTQAIGKLREQWNGTTEFLTISGTCPAGVTRVILYVGTQAGSEFFLNTIDIPSGNTTWTYTDSGSIAENINRIAPVGDSTAGPKVTRTSNIKGQLYMVGDSDNPGRIWFGGSGTFALDFSSFNGGGWVEPNKGGKDFPVTVKPFRDGKGTPMAVCFSKGTNGAGKRYLLSPATTTLGTTTISYMSVQEDNGQDGTDSPDGVALTNDGVWYPSRSGFKTSNTKANIQNIISTSGISDNIAPDVNALSSKYMENCVSLVNDQRIYWTLASGSTTNNQVWALDLRQNGAWVRPWYINADWLTLYSDNSDGKTKMLAVSNNRLYELDSTSATNDAGVPFPTNAGSGTVKVGKNGESANLRYVKFIFLRPQGQINLSVTVHTEDGPLTFTDSINDTSNQSVSAFGAYGWGSVGWGNITPGISTLKAGAAKERVTKTIEIDEDCDYYSWTIGSTDAGVSYQLADVIDSKVPIGMIDADS